MLSSAKESDNNLTEAWKDNIVPRLRRHRRHRAVGRAAHPAPRSDSTDANGVFYYRIHSPVILIEFDQQRRVGTRHLIDPSRATGQHIHAVVRTPNGNDYGKDLLRQHNLQYPH